MTFRPSLGDPQSRTLIKLGTAVFSFLALTGILVWLLAFNQKLVTELSIFRENIHKQQLAIANLSFLKQESIKAKEIEPHLLRILPDTEQLLEVSAELESIAKAAGLNQQFAFGGEAPATGADPKSFGISISLSGNLRGLAAYLKALESLPQIIAFTHMEVNTSGDTAQVNAAGKVYAR